MSVKLLKKILQDGKKIDLKQFKEVTVGALNEYELLLEAFNRTEEGHILIDKSTREIVLVNRTIGKLLPRQTMLCTQGKIIVEAIRDKEVRDYVKSVITGEQSPSDRDFSFGEGEVRTLRFSFSQFSLSDKEYFDVKIKDITGELKREMKLRSTETLASMTTMAAGVAHEIKNPLAAMKIYTSLLRKAIAKGKSTEETLEFIDILDQETDRLNEIAVDFLFAVKPMDINLKMDSLNMIVMELADFVAVEAASKNIKVELDLDKFLPTLMLDRKLLRRALLNLVNNSFYAMNEGGILYIGTKTDGDYVKLTVADNGIGMSEELQKRVFEPYYTTKHEKGTGLGLTAVLKIVNAHKGEISLDSKQGVGTTFVLRFPIPSSERKALKSKEN